MSLTETFLLGSLTTMFAVAAIFFWRFWRETRDMLFLAFSVSFTIEALSRIPLLLMERPSEGAPWLYWIRMFATLLIVAAILNKNYGKHG